MKKNLIVTIVVILVVAAGSFFGGMKYGTIKKMPNGAGQRFNQMFGTEQRGAGGAGTFRANGANLVNGQILSKDDKSMTVKLNDGGSKIVFFTGATQFMRTATDTIDNLKVGDNVMANGTANADGSLNAESIQLRPSLPNPAPAANK
jgi:hypothetical protein